MTWIAAGTAAVSLVGGAMGQRSAKKAAEKQRMAGVEAMKAGQDGLNRQRDIFNPYASMGAQLQGRMPELTRRFTNEDFVKDPGYDWRMNEGSRALEGSQAAKGGLLSGNAMKEMTQYGQGFASNEFGKAFDRFRNQQDAEFGKLYGMGTFGAQGLSGAENNYGNVLNSSLIGVGNTQAAGQVGGSNAMMGGISQGVNALMDGQAMGSFSGGNFQSPRRNFNGTGTVDPFGGI
jgi:hypothetical protein